MKPKKPTNSLKAALLLCMTFLAPFVIRAQNITVSGTVVDTSQEPVIGVGVIQRGTTNGVTTDTEGRYSISVPSNATLLFSAIGFTAQEIAVNGQRTINVTLSEETEMLEDVVVVGYGVQRKSDVTGAISQVKAGDIANRPLTDAAKALQGKTAGVNMITTTGMPGAESTIRIRGYSSNGSSDPLYVVDGLRVRNINNLDPNTIQTIEVLKDAASAAIYGAEAGNGVIMVTTKNGQAGRASLTYSNQIELSNIRHIPDIMDGAQYVTKLLEGGSATQTDIDAVIASGYWDGKSTTRWSDYSFETGFSQRHTVSANGGNDRGQYFLSLSSVNENGMAVGDNDTFKRINGTVNGSYRITPWLRVGNTTTFFKNHRRTNADSGQTIYTNRFWGGVVSLEPIMSYTYSPDRLPVNMQNLLNQGIRLATDENGNYYGIQAFNEHENMNPAIQNMTSDAYSNSFGISGTLFAELTPLKGLTLTSRLGYRFFNTSSYTYFNYYYGTSVMQNTENNAASRNMSSSRYYQWENFANYTLKVFGGDLTAMIGMAFDSTYTENVGAGTSNVQYDRDGFKDVSYPAATATLSASGNYSESAKLAYFGRLGYNYKNLYYIQASLRADAADLSKLSKQNRWGYFPAVSGGWTLSNEEFFPKTPQISQIKLRASWGQNGSTSNLSGYPHTAAISTEAAGFAAGTDISAGYYERAYPNQLANPNLKWETSEQLDFGLDAKFFQDRLSFSVDWFRKETKDLLISGTTIPFETGNTAPTVNAGNVLNRGFEFELSYRNHLGNLNYSISGNLATLHNEVTYLDPTAGGTGYLSTSYTRFAVGYPVWHFWLYEYAGVDENGDPIIVDQDGSGTLTVDDRIDAGTGYGKFTYGLTLNLDWKGLDLTVFGTGSYGNKVFSNVTYSPTQNGYVKFHKERWSATDPTALGIRPRYGYTVNTSYFPYSTANLYDGSFFKIKQIQLGYTLPSKITQAIRISSARFFVSLDDWFCFTPYFGLDPEVAVNATSNIGVDVGAYPSPKRTIFGVNITF